MALAAKSKQELFNDAVAFGSGYHCVFYRGDIYCPEDYELGQTHSLPPDDRKTWVPMTQTHLAELCKMLYNIGFKTPKDFSDFVYVVEQASERWTSDPSTLLVKTSTGLKELRSDGVLHPPSGEFVPNTLPVMLNENPVDQLEVFNTVAEWVGGDEEEAHSLLHHLATALAPHWSAARYVLLLGSGRNGKSLLLTMLERLFGSANCSKVTRQEIAASSTTVTSLNGKLINIVYDGMAEYVKDSGNEKSLIVGEPVMIRRLYRSDATEVRTNGLFIEGLNREPKSSDKSMALQARLVRFGFPNKYEHDDAFAAKMTSERYVGALLALLIEHYVPSTNRNVLLRTTQRQQELKFEHMELNSPAVQFIEHMIDASPFGAQALIGLSTKDLYDQFKSWSVLSGDLRPWENPAIAQLMQPLLEFSPRRSVRDGERIIKLRTITGFTELGQQYIELKTGALDEDNAAVVED